MNKKLIYSELLKLVGKQNIMFCEPMSLHTTFRIGGPADYFVTPTNTGNLILLIQFALHHGIPYLIVGRGSNLIVSDKGIRGLVISTNKLTSLKYNDNSVTASCGLDLYKLSYGTASRGLSGLEFACGIPGSVGGAIYMNAGAYECDISHSLFSSKALEVNTEAASVSTIELNSNQHHFSYRHSVFQEKELIHLKSTFNLIPANKNSIYAQIRKLTKAREDKQPLDLPSAGSIFRRPKGFFTGKLIEECGLRGFRIGDAAISEKHCGFIVNLGKATAGDVQALIDRVISDVRNRYGVRLQTEVKFIGEK